MARRTHTDPDNQKTYEEKLKEKWEKEFGYEWVDKFTKIEQIKEIQLAPDLGGVFSMQYSPMAELLAVGFGNGSIRLYDPWTGALIKELRESRYGGYQIMCLRFHPKQPDMLLASTSDGRVYLCNTKTGDIEEKITEKDYHANDGSFNEINCLDFDCDGMKFATAGKDLCVRMYDAKTFKLEDVFEGYNRAMNPNTETVGMKMFSLKFHPDDYDVFLTGGWDNHIQIWDVRKGGVSRTIAGPHICGDSLDLRKYTILSGSFSAKHSLQEWDWTTGKCVKDIPFNYSGQDGAYLYCAEYCDNDVVIAGGKGTGSVEAINKETGEIIGELKLKQSAKVQTGLTKSGAQTSEKTKPIIHTLDATYGGRLFAFGGNQDYLHFGRLI